MKKASLIGIAVILSVLFAAILPANAQGNTPTTRIERAEVRYLIGMIDHHQMALDMAHSCHMSATTESLLQLCQNIITNQQREINEMRGWLLIWYGLDYHPMSMHNMMMGGGMMQGGMMGGMMDGGMMQGGMMGGMMDGGMMGGQNQGGMMQGTPMAPTQMPGGQHDQHHPGATPMAPDAMPQGGMMQDGMMGGMMSQEGWVSSMPMMGMMAGLHVLTGRDFEIAWLEAMIEHHDDALNMSERILTVTERPELQALAQRIIDDQTAEIELMESMITGLSGEA